MENGIKNVIRLSVRGINREIVGERRSIERSDIAKNVVVKNIRITRAAGILGIAEEGIRMGGTICHVAYVLVKIVVVVVTIIGNICTAGVAADVILQRVTCRLLPPTA